MRNLFGTLLLSLFVLLAQQGAALHALSHHSIERSHAEGDHDAPPAGALCAGCVASTHMGAALSTRPVAPLLLNTLTFSAPQPPLASGPTLTGAAARSRGPPLAA